MQKAPKALIILTLRAINDKVAWIFNKRGNVSWSILRLSIQEIFARALRTAVAVSARHLASLLARQVAVSLISSARTRTSNFLFATEF